jgi:hypothetical protein
VKVLDTKRIIAFTKMYRELPATSREGVIKYLDGFYTTKIYLIITDFKGKAQATLLREIEFCPIIDVITKNNGDLFFAGLYPYCFEPHPNLAVNPWVYLLFSFISDGEIKSLQRQKYKSPLDNAKDLDGIQKGVREIKQDEHVIFSLRLPSKKESLGEILAGFTFIRLFSKDDSIFATMTSEDDSIYKIWAINLDADKEKVSVDKFWPTGIEGTSLRVIPLPASLLLTYKKSNQRLWKYREGRELKVPIEMISELHEKLFIREIDASFPEYLQPLSLKTDEIVCPKETKTYDTGIWKDNIIFSLTCSTGNKNDFISFLSYTPKGNKWADLFELVDEKYILSNPSIFIDGDFVFGACVLNDGDKKSIGYFHGKLPVKEEDK